MEIDQVLSNKDKNSGTPKLMITLGIALVALWALTQLLGIVIIGEGKVGVLFSQLGSSTAEGRFIVEKGEKGTWREVLKPGMHFLGPQKFYMNVTTFPALTIPPGKIGVVNALDGLPMPEGEIIAEDDRMEKGKFIMGEKGIRRNVLMPGMHYINPKYLNVKLQEMLKIPENKYGMLTRKAGPTPTDGSKLVSMKPMTIDGITAEFKGMVREVLKPGTYPINPEIYDFKIMNAINVPAGKVGIRIRKIGTPPPSNMLLVDLESDFAGIVKQVDPPGFYFVNLNEFDYEIIDAVSIQEGFVGVKVSRVGKEAPAGTFLVDPGFQGIQKKPLVPGLYYINPYETTVVKIDTRQQKYEMTKIADQGDTGIEDDISFRSDDGFNISVDLTVVYQIEPENAPWVVATLGKDIDSAITKIIRPSARSFARLEGSLLKAEEFVRGKTRSKFQLDLHKKLQEETTESKIKVISALLRNYTIPEMILNPIREKEIAEKEKEKYIVQQEREKELAKLGKEKAMVEQLAKKTMAETEKIQQTIKADQEKEIALIKSMKEKEMADITKQKMEVEAEARLRVAEIEKLVAEQYKQKKLLEAEADSTYKAKLMSADGALTEKLKAYVDSVNIMAKAIKDYKGNWSPQIVMGGGSGASAGAQGVSNAESLMQLLTVKTARDLALDLTPKATGK